MPQLVEAVFYRMLRDVTPQPVSTRIYLWGARPEQPTSPWAQFLCVSGRAEHTHQGPLEARRDTMQLGCFARMGPAVNSVLEPGRIAAQAADSFRRALDGFKGNVDMQVSPPEIVRVQSLLLRSAPAYGWDPTERIAWYTADYEITWNA